MQLFFKTPVLGGRCVLIISGCAWLGGCGSSDPAASGGRAPSPAVANKLCPIYPDEKVDRSDVVQWKGVRIGLCCDECEWDWRHWSDEEKDDYVRSLTGSRGELASAPDDAGD